MRTSVNTGLESNATRSISSGLVNRLGQSSSFWSDIDPFSGTHLLPAGVGFAVIADLDRCCLQAAVEPGGDLRLLRSICIEAHIESLVFNPHVVANRRLHFSVHLCTTKTLTLTLRSLFL